MLIVLEGIDGCGKSTHAKMLGEWLRDKGKEVLLTAEPTGGEIGRLIRDILGARSRVESRTLALLFSADRMEHIEVIRRALEAGAVVVSERYYYSTVAYQSAQGVDRKWLMEMNKYALRPDLVVFLDVDPKAGAERTTTGEIFEKEEFLKKVLVEYRKFRRMSVVDSSRPLAEVQEDIRNLVGRLL